MTAGADRRRTRRRTIEEHGIVSARVRPGRDVALIDVSAGGALIESAHRLLPGTIIELRLAMGERCTSVRGCVLRCAVARLRPTSVWYRGAIGFDRDLSWFVNRDGAGYPVPSPECDRRSHCGERLPRSPDDDRGAILRNTHDFD